MSDKSTNVNTYALLGEKPSHITSVTSKEGPEVQLAIRNVEKANNVCLYICNITPKYGAQTGRL